jgi:uncharacterized protein (DUF1015 family)
MAAGNLLSFLHVSKPEIDLPPTTDIHSPEVYAKGKENFAKLISQGALKQDAQPCFYLYRQIMGKHSQVGLVAAASCEEYLKGIIKKHEFTHPDKEDDRVRHIETLNSQTGPVFLTYRAKSVIDKMFALIIDTDTPDVDFVAKDGVQHTSWSIKNETGIGLIKKTFEHIPFLYIADGHHRSAAAAQVYLKRSSSGRQSAQTSPVKDQRRLTSAATVGNSGQFLAVIFPHNQMQILPYNRVLKDLNGLTPETLLQKVATVFEIKPNGKAQPVAKHELGLFIAGQWHTLNFKPQFTATSDPIERLDVTILQKQILAPVFGIDDPRTSKRINFVGGIRGAAELEKLVNSGEYACAFSMFPTSIEDLMAIADAGGIMPPKSTWFEPKLRDAMFCHMI